MKLFKMLYTFSSNILNPKLTKKQDIIYHFVLTHIGVIAFVTGFWLLDIATTLLEAIVIGVPYYLVWIFLKILSLKIHGDYFISMSKYNLGDNKVRNDWNYKYGVAQIVGWLIIFVVQNHFGILEVFSTKEFLKMYHINI